MDSASRQPRGFVQLNKKQVPGWIEIDVNQNSFYSADTFRVKFKADAVNTPAALLNTNPLAFELFAGLPKDPDNYTARDLTSLISGDADKIEYDPISRVFEASGRDYTARFLDNKTIERWQDKLPHEIAETLALRRGLTSVVSKTSIRAGKQYTLNEYARMTDERTEWDILAWLAHENGFVVYVTGDILYFGEPPVDDNPFLLTYTPADGVVSGSPSFNGKYLKLSRNLTVAKALTVTVYSHSMKTGQTVRQSFPRNPRGTAPGNAEAPAQNYFIIRPGLSADAAYQLAASTAKEIAQHELRVSSSDLPADVSMSVARQIQLRGTGTIFDQTYYPDKIDFHISVAKGFTMSVDAKNTSAENAAAVSGG